MVRTPVRAWRCADSLLFSPSSGSFLSSDVGDRDAEVDELRYKNLSSMV